MLDNYGLGRESRPYTPSPTGPDPIFEGMIGEYTGPGEISGIDQSSPLASMLGQTAVQQLYPGGISPDLRRRIQRLYPWMTEGLIKAYSEEWTISESDQQAVQAVRQTPEYQATFRGNYDPESGAVRMSESDYLASRAAFNAALVSVNLNPAYFEDDFITALENEVSPAELTGRLEAAYERVIQAAPDIREYYAQAYNIDLTDSAILAAAINPNIGNQILNRQIAVAEIGGEAAARGFGVDVSFAERLVQANMDRQAAAQFFGEARNVVPAMEILLRRHQDPDDEFDLEDITSAYLFDDPRQRRRIRQAAAAETSLFTGGQYELTRGQAGNVAGLART